MNFPCIFRSHQNLARDTQVPIEPGMPQSSSIELHRDWNTPIFGTRRIPGTGLDRQVGTVRVRSNNRKATSSCSGLDAPKLGSHCECDQGRVMDGVVVLATGRNGTAAKGGLGILQGHKARCFQLGDTVFHSVKRIGRC
jgi:hypothetical protein